MPSFIKKKKSILNPCKISNELNTNMLLSFFLKNAAISQNFFLVKGGTALALPRRGASPDNNYIRQARW